MSEHLIELMQASIILARKLQDELDKLVPPTTTGYLRNNESWTVAWVREGNCRDEIEMAIDPPNAAYNWHRPDVELLRTLEQQLGCRRLYAFPYGSGKTRYIATWDRPKKDTST